MKRFMYLSIGVLCLSLAALIGFHLGSQSVQAQACPQKIFGMRDLRNLQALALDQNGDTWFVNLDNGWSRLIDPGTGEPWPTTPVPAEQVAFWSDEIVVTKCGDLWIQNRQQIPRSWVNMGSPPITVGIERNTWGGVKDQYKR